MTTITVVPAELTEAAASVRRATDPLDPVVGGLTAAAGCVGLTGDSEVAAALGEFVDAWGNALPTLLDAVRQLSSALDGAAELYRGTDAAVAGRDH